MNIVKALNTNFIAISDCNAVGDTRNKHSEVYHYRKNKKILLSPLPLSSELQPTGMEFHGMV